MSEAEAGLSTIQLKNDGMSFALVGSRLSWNKGFAILYSVYASFSVQVLPASVLLHFYKSLSGD